MTAVRKNFSRALYEAYDKQAKDALVSHLESKDHVIVNTEENYFVDVVSQKHGLTFLNEAEVKVAWENDWPEHWDEIRIPERKQRLLDKYEGDDGVLFNPGESAGMMEGYNRIGIVDLETLKAEVLYF